MKMNTTYDSINRVWSGATVDPIFNPKNSIGQIIFHQLSNFANKVIQIDDTNETSVTGKQALTWGIRIAQHLTKMQLDYTDVIGIAAPNSTYILPVALGCFFNCSPFHTVNPTLDEDIIGHCYGLTKPKIIFCAGNDYGKIKKATELFRPLIYTVVKHIANVPSVLDLLEETETEKYYKPEKLTLDGAKQTAAIVCTSGTTGPLKAACLSTPVLLTNDWYNINDSVFYTPSGIDWTTGMYYFVNSCIRGYTRIIHTGGFKADYFLELVSKYNINTAFISSGNASALVQHPRATRDTLSSLRTIIYGGTCLSEGKILKLAELCGDTTKRCFTYGSTETYFISSSDNQNKYKSTGKLTNGLQIVILDENGHRLAHNEQGEILVRGPDPWIGYYGNQSESERAVDSKGWFRTGDVGYMDNDNDLFIVDRIKDNCKYEGFTYWPREIEEVIAELPDVRDVCVVALLDEYRGDMAGALVVKAVGSAQTQQNIIDHVREGFKSPHKHLNSGAYFVDQLPQNHNGKVVKKMAKVLLQQFVEENDNIECDYI